METYSWQHRQGVLLETLRMRLEKAGVRFAQVPRQTLVRRLAQEQTSWLAGLLATFLNHVKSGSLSAETLRTRARETGDRRRNQGFLDVFDQVRARYQKLLADEETLDFHDLINLARATSARADGSRNTGTCWWTSSRTYPLGGWRCSRPSGART